MTTLPLADAEHLARELRAHQLELEQQNEELLRAQLELAAARDRYQDLFEVAPVGYLSLDEAGRIAELNLTGASLLGQPRQQLIGRAFATVLHRSERRRWRNHVANLDGAAGRGRIEMTLDGDDMAPRHVQADTLRVIEPAAGAALRLTLTDITERRAAETDRRIAAHLVEAREGERQRVARALHEDLGQRLSVLKMTLSVLARGALAAGGNGNGNGATQAAADEVVRGLDEAIAVVRQMVNELHPSILDDLGLNAAMQWLADEAATRLGLLVRLHAAAGDPRLDRRSAVGVYRLMESLLSDVARDEPGAQVDIELQECGEQLHLWLTARAGGWPAQPDVAHRTSARRPAAGSPTALARQHHTSLLAELRTLGGRLIEARADAGAYRVHAVLPRGAAVHARSRTTGTAR
jgi:two-component system sensor histidine kinase UhpB